jgi:hypothetical protein
MSKASQTADPSAIEWANVTAKRVVEDVTHRGMAIDVMDMGSRVRVLSFPAAGWIWEQNLMDRFRKIKFDITGIERDPVVHKRSVRTSKSIETGRCSMHPKPCDLRTYLGSAAWKDTFDIIYLDWMGTWSSEKKQDLRQLFSQPTRLNKGGLLIMTMSLNRGYTNTIGQLSEFADNPIALTTYDERGRDVHTSGIRVRGIPQWIMDEASQHGITMSSIMANVYYSQPLKRTRYATPMVQFLMKREA